MIKNCSNCIHLNSEECKKETKYFAICDKYRQLSKKTIFEALYVYDENKKDYVEVCKL